MSGPTPSQTIGPFFHGALTPQSPAAAGAAPGSILIRGTLRDGAGASVSDAWLESWSVRADDGSLDTPAGPPSRPDALEHEDSATNLLCRTATGPDGCFELRTPMPAAPPDLDGQPQAPHLVLQIFARGLLAGLSTRIYFDGHPGNDKDPVLIRVPPERRSTLIAARDELGFQLDIWLQGPDETVFFDL